MNLTVCPDEATLSAWLDDELSDRESRTIRSHLKTCPSCRPKVLAWAQSTGHLTDVLPATAEATAACLDPETLVAYCEAELGGDSAAHAEHHLELCARCVSEAQRLIELKVAAGGLPSATPLTVPTSPGVEAGWGERLRTWLGSTVAVSRPRWPAVGALAATAVVVLAIARYVALSPQSDDVQIRGASAPPRVEVIADSVPAHARPSDAEAIVATLSRGTIATRLEESGGWARLQLSDGRRAWVRSAALARAEVKP